VTFLMLLVNPVQQAQEILDADVFELITTKLELDSPRNALLMRADLHAQFDVYEFGFDGVRL
jgi:hypothetical protein